MTTTSSIMLRTVSRSAFGLSRHLGRDKVLNNLCSAVSVSRTSFGSEQNGRTFSERCGTEHLEDLSEPQLAVAYAYDVENGYSDDKSSNTIYSDRILGHHSFRHDVTPIRTPIPSASGVPPGRSPSSSTPYPPPSSMVTSKGAPSLRPGGGGNGRHRCPTCGTTVTFRCDYDENSFYCASCSGWFVVNPNKIQAIEEGKPGGSPYEEFMVKNGPIQGSDPEILMRHVS